MDNGGQINKKKNIIKTLAFGGQIYWETYNNNWKKKKKNRRIKERKKEKWWRSGKKIKVDDVEERKLE